MVSDTIREMKIGYTFRFADYLALCAQLRELRHKTSHRVLLYFAGTINAFYVTLLFLGDKSFSVLMTESVFVIWLSAMALLVFFYVFYAPWVRRRHYKRLNLDNQTIVVVASEKELYASQDGMSSQIAWNKIVRFSKSQSHAFLWINKIQAVVLPYDAFASVTAREEFLKFVEEQIQRAVSNNS